MGCGYRFRGQRVLTPEPYKKLSNWILFCPEAGGLQACKILPCFLIAIMQTHLSLALPFSLAQKGKAQLSCASSHPVVPSPVSSLSLRLSLGFLHPARPISLPF